MKRILMIFASALPWAGMFAAEVELMPADTVISVEGKRIEVREDSGRVKVKVYKYSEEGNPEECEKVFEGHYSEGQSSETRKIMRTINTSLRTMNKKFKPHWAGFGMGFANFADGSLKVNDVDGISLRSGNSLEYNLNFMEKSFPFSFNRWAVVTGAGLRWSRYRVAGNMYFQEKGGVTSLFPQEQGYNIKTSKLNITSLTIPVLLEWQNQYRGKSRFFLSAGIVGVIKTVSSSRIVYYDDRGEKHKQKMDTGMNIRPVTMDFLVQAGYRCIGVYAKYAPFGLFESGKGPKVHPVSIGLHLHI